MRNSERGLAILETTAIGFVLLQFILGACCLVAYLQDVHGLRYSLDKSLFDVAGSANIIERSGAIASADINRLTDEILEKVVTELPKALSVSGFDPGMYLIEAQSLELSINQRTGISSGEPRLSRVTSLGLLSVESASNIDEPLDRSLRKFVADSTGGVGEASNLAFPSGSYSFSDTNRYIETALIIGVRVFVSTEGSLTGLLLPLIGREQILAESKVVTLRGDY